MFSLKNEFKYSNLQEHLTFLTIQDPNELTNKGFQQTDSISVWSRHGRHTLNAEEYMNIVDVIKPDIYLALCDGDTDCHSTAKHVQKSVRRSENLLKQCLARHNNSETLKFSGILGAVEGGYEINERERCINYLKNHDSLLGYVIDGLHRNGPKTATIKYEEIEKILQHTIVRIFSFRKEKNNSIEQPNISQKKNSSQEYNFGNIFRICYQRKNYE